MWHLLRAKASAAGLIGRPGCPDTLLDVDAAVLLSFAESVLYEGGEENAKRLDDLYRDAAPKPRRSRAERNTEIARVAALFA